MKMRLHENGLFIRNGWRAGYIERCKSGSEGGSRKPVPVTGKGAGCLPYALTSGYLKSQGHKVLRFDPSDAEGASAAFNPLAEVRLDSIRAIPDVQQIASMVLDPDGKGLEDHWAKAGFAFFGGAMLHCLIKTLYEKSHSASLYDVAVMLADPDRPASDVFQEMLNMNHAAMLAELFPGQMTKETAEAAHVFIASAAFV